MALSTLMSTLANGRCWLTKLGAQDDMRPSVGPYAIPGQPSPYSTPTLDKIAAEGITFTRAYIQFSYCAPSRNSVSAQPSQAFDRFQTHLIVAHAFRTPGVS